MSAGSIYRIFKVIKDHRLIEGRTGLTWRAMITTPSFLEDSIFCYRIRV